METLQPILDRVLNVLNFTIFNLGGTTFTIRTLIYFVLMLLLLFYFTGKLKRWIVKGFLAQKSVDIGAREAIGSIARYSSIAIGIAVILQSIGVNLNTVLALTGALGIGIGFGLQNITNNFVSGIIILFERPIKVGDRIEVGGVNGDVVSISPRATTVVTNDNIAIIVPNSEFISSTVTNWSYTDKTVRFNYPVGVSYGSDPEKVRSLLLEVARRHPGVLDDPAPDVLFKEFGESSLNFTLRVWTRDYHNIRSVLQSELNYAIWEKFKEHGVEIPFPQRDLHIRSGAIELKQSLPTA